jgi:hypothetical protein
VQPDDYIETWVRQRQDWHGLRASSSASRYLRMRGAAVAGGAVVSLRARVLSAAAASSRKGEHS